MLSALLCVVLRCTCLLVVVHRCCGLSCLLLALCVVACLVVVVWGVARLFVSPGVFLFVYLFSVACVDCTCCCWFVGCCRCFGVVVVVRSWLCGCSCWFVASCVVVLVGGRCSLIVFSD